MTLAIMPAWGPLQRGVRRLVTIGHGLLGGHTCQAEYQGPDSFTAPAHAGQYVHGDKFDRKRRRPGHRREHDERQGRERALVAWRIKGGSLQEALAISRI